jgi:hypothetical protein
MVSDTRCDPIHYVGQTKEIRCSGHFDRIIYHSSQFCFPGIDCMSIDRQEVYVVIRKQHSLFNNYGFFSYNWIRFQIRLRVPFGTIKFIQ